MNNLNKIDNAIKKSWMKIKKDYNKDFLLEEDSLKSSFYYHLRKILKEKYLESYDYRIYTELHIKHLKADLAIVELNQNKGAKHLGDRISRLLAIVEFKYKNAWTDINIIKKDIKKFSEYEKMEKIDKKTRFYFAFICEKKDDIDKLRKLAKSNKNICVLTVDFAKSDDFYVTKCVVE